MQKSRIKTLFKKALLFWVILISVSFGLVIHKEYDHAFTLALNEAQTSIKKDLIFRKWVALHGGVYVPATEKTPPNRYMNNIPERDIQTPSGKKLTLMNPAYTLSHMMKEYSELYGIKGHPTSLKLINQKNKPDEWEHIQLKAIEKTKKPRYETVDIEGAKYLRYINPMITEEECLKCHRQQGYKVGDVRGAVSVAIPVKDYYDDAFDKSLLYGLFHIVIFFIGLLAIKVAYSQSRRWLKENNDYRNELQEMNKILETKVQDGIRELRSKDDMLMKQSKNAAMGEMIANIAHQWRQPLNALGLTVQDLGEAKDYGELSSEYVDKIVNESMSLIYSMSKTIDDFGNFFKQDKDAIEFNVADVVNEVRSVIGASLKNNWISLEVKDGHKATLYGFKNEFFHVLLNIISNAKDAFKDSSIENKKVVVTIEDRQDEVVVRIADNAGGIPKEIIDRIFEPYFTTKFKDNGTGIGLYMSKTIIEKNMRGRLDVRNIEKGAEFIIALPK